MARRYSEEEFSAELEVLVNENKASNLFSIPGVYELVAEEFNNEVLDRLDSKLDDDDEGEAYE